MKVFIDTNILLDIYQLSGPDLEELRKLVKLVETSKVELLVTRQVLDEFWRNRESVIADSMKIFRETKATTKIPNIVRSYKEAQDLSEAVNKVNEIVKRLDSKITEDIHNNRLKADELLNELFSASKVGEITPEIVDRAKRRVEIGNPPGKNTSLGDAVNWEWLMDQDVESGDHELIILSADGDYESELIKGNPKEFLLREWEKDNPECDLVLEKTLTGFLISNFPDIKLAEEVGRLAGIEMLEESCSYVTTHQAIGLLSVYDDFKDTEIQRMVKAYLENNQVHNIILDPDVFSFAFKIIGLAKKPETKELASKLQDFVDKDIPF